MGERGEVGSEETRNSCVTVALSTVRLILITKKIRIKIIRLITNVQLGHTLQIPLS